MFSLLLSVSLALFAPAPLAAPKQPVPTTPVGDWVLEWNGGTGPATFSPDGGFSCLWCGQLWLGEWALVDGMLTVHEWLPAQDEWTPARSHLRWSATLRPGTLEGPLDSGGMFHLRKPLRRPDR